MIRESYDEIYNGPRRNEPLATGTLGDVGYDTDSAFALGRELYKQGRPPSYLTARGKNKTKAWLAALRKGYAWQQARS
jgi:hypothetical protein